MVSLGGDFEGDDFAGFAGGNDFEGTAADFAIGREPLMGDTGVDDHFAILSAIRALDVGKLFHAAIYARKAEVQMVFEQIRAGWKGLRQTISG